MAEKSAVDSSTTLLVFALCEQHVLPLEIADMIAGKIDRRDVLTIGALCQRFRKQAYAIVYRYIILDFTNPSHTGRLAVLLLRTLLQSRLAAEHVRHLSLTGEHLREWRIENSRRSASHEAILRVVDLPEIRFELSSFKPEETDSLKRTVDTLRVLDLLSSGGISLSGLCCSIIRKADCLRVLHITTDYFRDPDFRAAFRQVAQSGGLHGLQDAEFCMDLLRQSFHHIRVVEEWDDVALAPLGASPIGSLKAAVTLKQGYPALPPIPSLTRLTLEHYQTNVSGLDSLLAATPNLCFLEYNVRIDYGWFGIFQTMPGIYRKTGLDPLFKALEHVKRSLRELIASVSFTEDSSQFDESHASIYSPDFEKSRGLVDLECLHTLSIPYYCLIGKRGPSAPFEGWDKTLPPSLRNVTWTDRLSESFLVESWSDEELMPVIERFLHWMAKIRRPGQSSRFALELFSAYEDFNAPIRQKLKQLCSHHDFDCSIYKRLPDKPKDRRVHMPRGRFARRGFRYVT